MNARRRRSTILKAATVTVILLLFALPAAAQAGGTAAHTTAKNPIYIGQIAPLTGADALPLGPGVYFRAGARLALRQINAHGGIRGRPLKLVLIDDHSTPAGGIAAFERLVKAARLAAIIGPNSSAEIQAMTPSIERARIPVIIGGGASILTHEGDLWVFRTRPNATYFSRALSAFTAKTLHLSRIAILFPSGAGTELLADLKTLGIVPLTDQSYVVGAPDLTPQVLAIKKSGATALIANTANDAESVLLARQLHEAGLHLTWVGDAALSTAGTRRMAGSLVYGTYSVTPYAPGQSPEALAFNRYSEATLHLPGDFASAYSYDGLHILANVMRKVGTNPRAIRRAILAIRGYRGAMGTYNFDKHGEGLRQETVVRNVNGNLHVIKVLSF